VKRGIILKCVLINGLLVCGADCYVSVPGRMAGRRSRCDEAASVSLRSRPLLDQSRTACMHHAVSYMRTVIYCMCYFTDYFVTYIVAYLDY